MKEEPVCVHESLNAYLIEVTVVTEVGATLVHSNIGNPELPEEFEEKVQKTVTTKHQFVFDYNTFRKLRDNSLERDIAKRMAATKVQSEHCYGYRKEVTILAQIVTEVKTLGGPYRYLSFKSAEEKAA